MTLLCNHIQRRAVWRAIYKTLFLDNVQHSVYKYCTMMLNFTNGLCAMYKLRNHVRRLLHSLNERRSQYFLYIYIAVVWSQMKEATKITFDVTYIRYLSNRLLRMF